MNWGILVTSCHRDRDKQQAIRDTWGKHKPHPIFFWGLPWKHPKKDEHPLEVSDTYAFVPAKAHAMCWYALRKNWDWVFICDIDTYVDVPMLTAAYEAHCGLHYVGHRCDEGHAAGGNGYVLSGTAIWRVGMEDPPLGYADLWIGNILRKKGMEITHDPRFGNGVVTRHLGQGTGNYDPQWMLDEHKRRMADAEG